MALMNSTCKSDSGAWHLTRQLSPACNDYQHASHTWLNEGMSKLLMTCSAPTALLRKSALCPNPSMP